MPLTKPTVLPRWATGGSAQVVEPSEGQKDVGWAVGDKPPAQTFNWLQRSTHDWLAWLNDLANQSMAWSGNHSFAGNIIGPLVFANASDTTPMLRPGAAPVGPYRLLIEGRGSPIRPRLYDMPGGALLLTVNAAWDPVTEWNSDSPSNDAIKMQFDSNGIHIQSRSAAASWGDDTGWSIGSKAIDLSTYNSVGQVLGTDSESFMRPSDVVHGAYQRLGTEVAWLNGFTQETTPGQTFTSAAWRTPDGQAHLLLNAKNAAGADHSSQSICTLPVGLRPMSGGLRFPAVVNVPGNIIAGMLFVQTNGDVYAQKLPADAAGNLYVVSARASWPIDL